MATTGHDTGTDKLLVDVDPDARLARVPFNNPAKHKALSAEIRTALPAALGRLDADSDVRVIVVTGAGGRAFVSGADISEFADQRTSVEARAEYDRQSQAVADAWSGLG